MQLGQRLLRGVLVMVVLGALMTPAQAGMIGYPAPRLPVRHFRFELAVDSFKEDLQNGDDAEATTGRGLVTVAFGLTKWSEIFARVGTAEFDIDEALFSGDFGVAFGGGARLRLFTLPFGVVAATGQYLRFTSDDDDSAGAKIDGEWEEFDLAVGIATQRVGPFEFYLGGAYHQSDITLKVQDSDRLTLESDTPFRVFVGAHLYPLVDFPGGDFLVNVEARFIGETPQFTLGVQYQF